VGGGRHRHHTTLDYVLVRHISPDLLIFQGLNFGPIRNEKVTEKKRLRSSLTRMKKNQGGTKHAFRALYRQSAGTLKTSPKDEGGKRLKGVHGGWRGAGRKQPLKGKRLTTSDSWEEFSSIFARRGERSCMRKMKKKERRKSKAKRGEKKKGFSNSQKGRRNGKRKKE